MSRTHIVTPGLAVLVAAAALAALVTLAVALPAGAAEPGAVPRAGGTARAGAADAAGPSLVAWVSTHHPCSIPVVLRARLRDEDGEPVQSVRVRFRIRLAAKVVYRYARTDSRGLAKYLFHPRADTAPSDKRVRVVAKAVYRGDTLRGYTWFTPTYL